VTLNNKKRKGIYMNNEEPIITCVERLYKVVNANTTYFVKAKTELNKDVTDKLLQEDMELKTFLANYEITNINLSYRTQNEDKDKVLKVAINTNKSKLVKEPYKQPYLAGKLLQVQRVYIVKNELPEWFCMKDFTDVIEKKGYSPEDAYLMWKSTWNYLSKDKKLEKSKGSTASRKYRYIKDITPSLITEQELKNLKEGNKVVLGTFL
jgi:hypothetical protein